MSDDRFDDIEDFFADLDAKQDSESGVVQISDHFEDDVNIIEEDGDLKLRMRNPEGSENDWKKFNISFLRDVPGMQEVLKLGLLGTASGNAQISVQTAISGLRTGWVAFLLENKMSDLAVSKVSGTILTSFALFVRDKYSNNASRRNSTSPFRYVLLAYPENGPEYDAVRRIGGLPGFKDLIKKNQARSKGNKPPKDESRRFMSIDALMRILDVCEMDVRKTTSDWHEGQDRLAASRRNFDPERDHSAKELKADLDLLLGWLDQRFPSIITLNDSDELLTKVVGAMGGGVGKELVEPYFYPSAYTLMPFFLLLMIRTAWNLQPIQDLSWRDIEHLEGDRIVLAPSKIRAGGTLQPYHALAGDPVDPLSLASILSTLKEMTQRIRPKNSPFSDLVFLSSSNSRMVPFKGYNFGVRGNSFHRYLSDRGLDRFTLSSIRHTLISAAYSMTGDIRTAQKLGNHSTSATTMKHYISEDAKQKGYIRLAQIMSTVPRWVETEGKIDPRFRPSNSDKLCATTGFDCDNPYKSPLGKRDRLCNLAGYCVACPLGSLNGNDPKNVAYMLAYGEAVGRCHRMDPETKTVLVRAYVSAIENIEPSVLEQALHLPKPDVFVTE